MCKGPGVRRNMVSVGINKDNVTAGDRERQIDKQTLRTKRPGHAILVGLEHGLVFFLKELGNH